MASVVAPGERVPVDAQIPAWAAGQFALREAMCGWIEGCVRRWAHTPWGGGHDEAIFTRTWMAYYMLTGDQVACEFLDRLADEFIDSPVVEACVCFLSPADAAEYPPGERRPPYHGYCEDQACFVHGPENYAWFLTHMAHINPSPKIRRALEDCAEHVGNWSPDTPPWYDWERHRFRSALLGTGSVRDYPPYDFEPIALVRVMVLASNMYYLTREQKYLDVCTDWADKWADLVLDSDPQSGFATALFPCPVEEIASTYGELAQLASGRARCNYELASLLLDLYYFEPKKSYAQAVHKMLNTERDWLSCPGGSAGLTGMLAAKYRSVTQDTSLDSTVVELARSMMHDESDNRPVLLVMNKSTEQFLDRAGLAYAKMFSDGAVEFDTRSTGILTAAFMATGETHYLEYAMQLALNRFYDSHYLWDGRENGCRGSWMGRNGVALHNVMAPMMCPAMGGFGMLAGERPWFEVRYARPDGTPGLPADIAALYLPGRPDKRVVRFLNRGPAEEVITVVPDNTLVGARAGPLSFASAMLDGRPIGDPAQGIRIPPGRIAELSIQLE